MITPAYAPTATERVLPRLALDFTTGTLDPRVTVTRALNTATRVNSSGLVEIVNANLPRFDYDPATLAPKGLLIEETRSNSVTYSEQFNNAAWLAGASGDATITPDSTTSPDGTINADTMDDSSAVAVSGKRQQFAITSGSGSYTASCFIKKNTSNCCSIRVSLAGGTAVNGELVVDTATGAAQWRTSNVGTSFAVTSFGNGWFRVSATVTDNATGNNAISIEIRAAFASTYSPTINAAATGSIYVWGAQLETGAFATSYIPTTTTSVTRNADVVSMTGTNFSSWYNASEGTFTVQFDSAAVSASGAAVYYALGASDGTTSNINGVYLFQTTSYGASVVGGATQANITAGTVTVNTTQKIAYAYKANSFSAALNGAAANIDTSGSIPTVDRLTVGASYSGSNLINGHVAKLAFYPQRLTNNEVRAFSK